ncbi:MAG: AAA family ATPase [Ktedonobacteraceae bacterium]
MFSTHNSILVVTGIPGSGKNLLLAQLALQLGIASRIKIVQFGERLFTHLLARYPYLNTRDDINSILSQAEVKQGVIDLISWLIQNQPLILNTHVVYRQNNILTYNPDVEAQLNAKGYVFIWADPLQILKWRISDMTRVRSSETEADIALYQDTALQIVTTLAQRQGSGLTTVWNRSDNIQSNVTTLLNLARRLTS